MISWSEAFGVPAEPDPASLGSLLGCPSSRCNHLPLMFGDGGQDVESETSSVWVVAGHELYPGIHHGDDERHVAREPVQFGDDEPGLALSAGGQGFLQFRPVVAPARLDLGVLGQQDAADAREIAPNGRTLGLKAEAGLPLAVSAHPVVSDESCGFGLHLGVPVTTIAE
jgi:hypothetical protein